MLAVRLICAVGTPYRYAETIVETECAGQKFRTKGKTATDIGWRRYAGKPSEEAEKNAGASELPELSEGMTLEPVSYTHLLIMVDRKKLKNPNGLILGTPGSGKSFSAKREIANAFLVTDDDVIVCDPEAEYTALVKKFEGQVIKISPSSAQYINPMDINANYSEEDTLRSSVKCR